MLVQIDVQEPTISVCRVPYARASGFALIAKLPVTFQPMTPLLSERDTLPAVCFLFEIKDRHLVVVDTDAVHQMLTAKGPSRL